MISLFAIKQILNPNANSFINNLKNSEISVFLVTGDKYLRSVAVGYDSGILDTNNELIRFESNQED